MTRDEAVQSVGRLAWGLQFVQNRMASLSAEDQAAINDAADAMVRCIGEDWQELSRQRSKWPEIVKRWLAHDADVAESLLSYAGHAVEFGFARLRDETDYKLALAIAEQGYWEGLIRFCNSPKEAIKQLSEATGQAIGTVAAAAGEGAGAGLGGFLSGLAKSPIIIVAALVWILMLATRKPRTGTEGEQ